MKNKRIFLSENFQFLEVKFSIYLNRHVFVMQLSLVYAVCLAPLLRILRINTEIQTMFESQSEQMYLITWDTAMQSDRYILTVLRF